MKRVSEIKRVTKELGEGRREIEGEPSVVCLYSFRPFFPLISGSFSFLGSLTYTLILIWCQDKMSIFVCLNNNSKPTYSHFYKTSNKTLL